MPRHGTVPGLLRRSALLLAALLHLAGAAVLPALHAPELGRTVSTVGAPAEAPQAPLAHDELHCAVCQAMGAFVLAAEGSVAVPLPEEHAAPAAVPHRPHLAPRGAASLARAPPALS
jgi:hypothetical protein